MSDRQSLAELLRWYVAAGADEAIGDAPIDRLTTPAAAPAARPAAAAAPAPGVAPDRAAAPAIVRPPAAVQPVPMAAPAMTAPPAALAAAGEALAAAATTLAELEAAVRGFEGCALKRTATNTVFADGVAGAPLMIVGEAPGADEDRLGRPFVGRSGQLLDRMLAAIGYSRERNAYITNVLFWRPPGNRKPTAEEIALCLPFVLRHIALARPRAVALAGGTATAAVLGRVEGITRLRGRWFELTLGEPAMTLPVLATFHPSFLLRAPARKSEVWRDLLALKSRIEQA